MTARWKPAQPGGGTQAAMLLRGLRKLVTTATLLV